MSKTLKLTVQTANEQGAQTFNVIQGGGKTGQVTTVRAVPAARYQLQDADNNAAPEKIKAKRMGKNLHLSLDASNEADLIIEGYYDVHTGTESGSIYTQLQDGAIHEYIAGSTGENLAISKLTDGASFVEQVISPLALDGAVVASAPAIGVVASVFPGALGAGAVGAVAVAEITKKDEDPIELSILRDAAQNNSAQAPAITAQTYAAAGVTGVTEANVAAINSALNSATITGAQAGNRAQLQAIVDAYKAIQDNADGTANNNATNPTQAQYAAIGVTGVSSATTVGLLGDVIDSKPFAAVDTVGEVQALADAANAVMTGAAGGAAPTLEQLQALGLTGVTSDNLPAVLAAIKATPDDGMGVDSLSELQAVVTAAADAAAAALDKIKVAADGNNAGTTPALADFAAAGVTGVTADNLAAVSSALNSAGVNGAAADTTAEVQAIVNGFNAILANAGDTANTAANVTNATQAQYAAVGVTGVSSANAESLLGDAVDGKPVADIDTVGELQALANAANAVLTGAAGGTAPTLAQLQALGITGVTADNLPAVLAAIAATPDNGTGVNTLSGLQDVVTTAATAATSALTKIKDAAQADSAGTTPALADFAAAGVTGVTADNLAAVSSALNSAGVNGAAADTTAEVQAIVNGFNAILANAGDTANTAANVTNPTKEQYEAIGVTDIDTPEEVSLLGDVIDGKAAAAVGTTAQVQALADAVQAVQTGTATVAQLEALGITGVTADNIKAVQAALVAASPIGSSTALATAVSGAVTAFNSASTAISEFAEDNGAVKPAPTAANYTAMGVTGIGGAGQPTVAQINSALATAGVTGDKANTAAEVQAIVDGFSAIVANADGTANNNATNPTQAQYEAIGVTGIDTAAEVSLLGDVIDGKAAAAVGTTAQVQTLADAVQAVQTGTATVAQLEALGITGVTADNIKAVQAALVAASPIGSSTALATAVSGAVTAFNTASTAIENFAQDNGAGSNPSPAPTATNYTAMGVTGIGAAGQPTVAQINSALATAGVTGEKANTAAEVQAIVDGFSAIVANADGTANNNATNPTQAQYEAIGVTGIDTTAELGLLGDVIDGKAATAVGTAAQVQALADAVQAVQTGTATVAQLEALGITGVTADNIKAVQAALLAATPIGSSTALATAVSGAVTAFNSASTAISEFAEDNGAVKPAPTAANYTAMGVTGIGGAGQPTVAQINSALATAGVTGDKANTAAEVQAIVDGFSAIVANADGTANNNATNPTQAQYEAIGVTGIDTAAEVSLLGDVIDGKAAAAVGTTAQVQTLAEAVQAVQAGTATVAQLEALGITDVTADNLKAVQAALLAATPIGSSTALATAVSGAVTAFNSAGTAISDFAEDNGAVKPAPTAANYTAMGVTGIGGAGQPTVAQINSALATAGVTGDKANTAAEVQAIVDGFSAIVANADGTANNNATNPTQAQYEAIGVTGIDTTAELGLLGDVIDGKAATAVGTAAQVQDLAAAVQAVQTGTATVAQLEALGITDVTADNLKAVQAALLAATPIGSSTALATAVSGAVTAFNSAGTAISDFAEDNGAVKPAPTAANYTAMGVTGIGGAGQPTVAQINSALATAGVTGDKANTAAEVQAIVDGFSAIVANADGTANNNATNPTQAQYEAIGVTGIDTTAELGLLGDVIDGKAATAVGTAAQVQALADAVQAVQTGTATVAQLEALGITGVTADNLKAVQAALLAATPIGSSTALATAVSGAVTAFNSASTAIENFAQDNGSGSNPSPAPTAANYTAMGVSGIGGAGQPTVAQINSALASAGVTGDKANTAAEVQAIVDGFSAIVANADGTANNNATNPTQAQYEAIGVTGIDTAAEVSLLGDVIDGKAAAAVGTAVQVQDLADAVQAVQTGTATVAQLTALGVMGANAQNIASIQAALSSGASSLSALQSIVSGANDAPVNTVPGAQTTDEDVAKVITGLQIADADAGTSNMSVTLAVAHGTINVATGSGVTFTTGTNGTASVTLTGKLADINTLLATANAVTYTPTGNFNGSDTLTMTTSDGGNTGTGGTLSDADTVAITVNAINDAPVVNSVTAVALPALASSTAAPVDGNTTAGVLVSTLIGDLTDVDSTSLGMAVTDINGAGTLHYSVDGGAHWLSRSAGTHTDMVHLDGNSRVMYVSSTAGTISNAFRFLAWDKSNAAEAGSISAIPSTLGGSSAYSAETDVIGVRVVRDVSLNTISGDSQVTGRESLVVSGLADAGATVSGTINSTAFSTTADSSGNWSFNTGKVRFIMVRDLLQPVGQGVAQETFGIVSISDVKAIDKSGANVALNKTVLYSKNSNGTTTPWADDGANSLVDGATNTIAEVLGNDATSTNGDVWFQIDLGAAVELSSIQILARQESSNRFLRMDGTEVYTSLTDMSGKTRAELDASSAVNSAIIDTANGTLSTYTFNAPNTSDNSSLTTGSNTVTVNQTVLGISSEAAKTVTKVVDPVFTSLGTASVAENVGTTTTVYDATANSDTGMTYTLRGTDAGRFDINASTGAVTFKASPDFEAPVDIGTNNVYNFTVRASNSAGGYADQAVVVTVTDVGAAPVVIDVNRDGALTYGNVAMDISGDGHLDQTAWAGAGDGVLVWDKFADGVVHNNSQYAFAQYQTTPNADGSAATDLQGLAAGFDSNQDGVFDANDAKFAEFKVWQDANQNGVSDAGEVRSLADVGISSIDLTSDGVKRNPADGVTEAGRTTAAATDGSEVLVADAAFEYTRLAYTADAGHLNLLGTGINLDLSSFTALHGQISEVNLNGTGANTLKINLDDVLAGTTLKLQGGSDDTVALFHAEGWSQTGTSTDAGVTYNVWHHTASAEQLLIDQHLQVITA